MSTDETCELLCIDAVMAARLREGLPDLEVLERAAEGPRALADPTRLALALALRDAGAPCCVCDLAFVVGRQDKLVSHHLRQLRSAGLASARKEGRMVLYALTGRGRALLAAAMEAVAGGEPRLAPAGGDGACDGGHGGALDRARA